MAARCAWDAEERFESDVFNHRSVVQSEEHPSDTRKVSCAIPLTSICRYKNIAGEWNGLPFQPHKLKIAGSVSAPLRSALSERPLDVQRPAPATIAEWLEREAAPS